jgi:hypothetical protein
MIAFRCLPLIPVISPLSSGPRNLFCLEIQTSPFTPKTSNVTPNKNGVGVHKQQTPDMPRVLAQIKALGVRVVITYIQRTTECRRPGGEKLKSGIIKRECLRICVREICVDHAVFKQAQVLSSE